MLLSSPAALDQLFKVNNSDLLYADHDGNGYASATVTPAQVVAIFNKSKD
jgi:alkaline phosphatase D